MKFVSGDQKKFVQHVSARLISELSAGKRVVWLVSGGSNIPLQVEIMDELREKASGKLQNLTILPVDERYGAPGHENSNAEFMRKSGFVSGAAEWVDVLAHDVTLEETIEYYDDVVSEAMALAHVVIGQIGLGSDGHIAGILPGSPACEEDYATIVGYEWSDYVRLTLSPRALGEINVAFVPAYGANKAVALQRLEQNSESVEELPARLLYDISEVYVYNKLLESEA